MAVGHRKICSGGRGRAVSPARVTVYRPAILALECPFRRVEAHERAGRGRNSWPQGARDRPEFTPAQARGVILERGDR